MGQQLEFIIGVNGGCREALVQGSKDYDAQN